MIPQNFTRFPVRYLAQRHLGALFHAGLIPPYQLRRFGQRGVVLIYTAGPTLAQRDALAPITQAA